MKLNQLWSKHKVYNEFLEKFLLKNRKPLVIEGLQGSALSFFVSSLIQKEEKNQSLLFLAQNIMEAMYLYQDLITFTKTPENNSNIFIFPPYEVLPYEELPHDFQIIKQRMELLSKLSFLKNDISQNTLSPLVIISTYRAILPKMIPNKTFFHEHYKLKIDMQLNIEDFLSYLIEQEYQPTELIEIEGQFSQRGGIIDLFPLTEDNPIRIELEGDRVVSLRFFNPESQRSLKRIDEILLLPKKEISSSSDIKNREQSTFFDYLPENMNIIVHKMIDFKNNVKEFEQETERFFLNKKSEQKDILPPEKYYLNWDQIKDYINQSQQLLSLESWLKEENDKNNNLIKSSEVFTIETKPAEQYYGNLELFFKKIKNLLQEKQTILVLTKNEGRALRLSEIFEDRGLEKFQLLPLSEVDLLPGRICLSYGMINYGFSIPDLNLSVITEQEIFGKQREKSFKKHRFQGKPFYRLDELKTGDFVVHINHGIGRYAGIKSRKAEGIRRDYILIQYASGDELYVPVEQLSMVHKYVGVGGALPKLNRLTDSSWKTTKRKVKESVKKIALELFDLYKKRSNIDGFSFSTDTVWQQELELAFPFEETPDQEKAFQDVKRDMESPHPMERLICGDVGYGKTEIAIRAAFKAVMDNKQVAVLAPTTILAQQHWENFSERIKPFPVRIEMLSRFKTKKEQKEIIADLKKGNIDIVVGTHRLVQPDIDFKDLGLLIVDEEQRFGVNHKERIKKIREQVDSLTLTATPIPRTMYFSLAGIREMSIINTPPELRLPIITFFKPKTDGIIKEAIKRELNRGGQVYYVHNRVQDIDEIAEKLNLLIPEAKIVVAHGQMQEDQLENIMVEFFNRNYDILVCTTIIEIGLDIPNVNTIIIDDAHKFGLSQLYQLRGRVGRSSRRAYAYLLYPPQKSLSDNAKKRLDAIKEFSDLGSGYRLAMRDLEIRGAGNLLGKEQHGFASEVGFSYYCHLLEESIRQITDTNNTGKVEQESEQEPEIDVKIDSYIPEYYIANPELRINYYQRLSQIKTEDELDEIRRELQDIYGYYPEEMDNLLQIMKLKIRLSNKGVTNVVIKARYILIKYRANSPIAAKIKHNLKNIENLSQHQRGGYYQLRFDFKKENMPAEHNNILYQYLSFLEKLSLK